MSVLQVSPSRTALHDSPGMAQYLTFILAEQEYGIDILRVQEIKGWEHATVLPKAPSYVKGVFNLRGTVVPLIDLRERFGLPERAYDDTTVVIVLKVLRGHGHDIIGVVVDAVADVYTMAPEHLHPAPQMGSPIDTAFVQGLATVEDKMIITLNIDHLLNAGELDTVRAVLP
ncbi:MAG: chemotaxis protein CheW [Candidatus Tectimicrobiota bacterium]